MPSRRRKRRTSRRRRGRQAGHAGNLMLKCIYSSQMISKSDKDPQRDWQGVAGRRQGVATAAKFYEICCQAPSFTASRAEAASAPGCASIDKLSVSFNISSGPALALAPPLAGASAMSVVIVIVSESQRDLKLISFRFTCAQNKLKPICLLLFILLTSLPPSLFLCLPILLHLLLPPRLPSSLLICLSVLLLYFHFRFVYALVCLSRRLVPSRPVSSRLDTLVRPKVCTVLFFIRSK